MSTTSFAPIRASDHEAEAWLRSIVRGIRRDWWLILAILTTVTVLAIIFTKRQEPVYESGATLLFHEPDRPMNLISELDPRRPMAGGGIETDMAVLRSRMLAQTVVDSLALNVRLQAPSIPRSQVFQHIRATDSVAPGTYELVRGAVGTYLLQRVTKDSSVPVQPGIVPGRPVSVSGLSFTLSPDLARSKTSRIRFSVISVRSAADLLRQQLAVLRPDPKAEIVLVQYRSLDPVIAATVPNVVSETYIRYKQQSGQAESGSTVDFLREQVASYAQELKAAEDRLQQFREQSHIVSLEDEASEQVTRLAELKARRDQINTEATSLRRLLADAEAGSRSPEGDISYRRLASFPAFFSNKAVQDILSSLMELENERGRLLVRRTTENVDVRGINQRIGELENQLYQMARSYLSSLDNQRSSMDAELAQFGQQLEMIPAREIQFARLARERELLGNMYTLLQTRLKEAEIRNAAQVGNVRILDPALVPETPISPRPLYNFLIALVLGLILAGVTILVRNALDQTVWTREEAVAVAGGLPVLGAIPRVSHSLTGVLGNGRTVLSALRNIKFLPLASKNGNTDTLVTWRAPRSVASEAFRGLRTSVGLAADGKSTRMVMITSPMAGDGKSMSSANLAITYAQQGVRTLLVDADLRSGTLQRLLGVPDAPGLSEVLTGRATLEEALHEVRVGDGDAVLHFLDTGAYPPNPAELIGSPQMRRLLSELRERYEIVLLDVPPVALVSDALIIGNEVDAALLVARLGSTDRDALETAVQQLHRLQIPFEGLVLNDAPLPKSYYYAHQV
ncbi:MAG TPA: polysaccharide biosynthesis tyrosine autokinase [Longimicrobiaceae bacterium]|nr:polysaccharide biosynthesis tyrosine autokinase [Longimicrobiaceae bacterium]